jgi:hypothetical protein
MENSNVFHLKKNQPPPEGSRIIKTGMSKITKDSVHWIRSALEQYSR